MNDTQNNNILEVILQCVRNYNIWKIMIYKN